ncbi:glycosyltransferase [Roseimaritima ulvae]|uniref:GDP-mannose-dependent alpha-(1-6)-phosphatidylinositol monomannoside mannosyltransferase n=1 Tax=Roseimaritima ulvae TaxID=980254 RepID=A0A5B9QM85_9BACT|nr:glycosyltransferase [Roseimaritima ulvae]QEG38615.1 GDP-mannose-dependent alpha-(1-6)-phosphatidylinositol monomannoside mannosyltransferase [Roseimaritima ulvae]
MSRLPLTVLLMSGSMDGGGSERQTLLLAQHLDRQQFRPILYLRHRQGVLLDQVPADVPIVSFDDAPAVGWPRWPGRVGGHHSRYLRHILQQHQVEVVYDRTFQMTMAVAPAATALGLPRVSTIVSPPAQMLPRLEPRYLAIKRRRLARAYAGAYRVIAVSRAAAQSAAEYYHLPPDKLTTIHNPVDIAATQQRAAAACETAALAQSRQPPQLVCIGRLSEEKGQTILLQAMQRLAAQSPSLPWQLWIVGDGPQRAQLQRQAADSGLDQRVTFTGHLNNPLPLLAAADGLLLPSLFEGLPNVVLEAMCLRIPVVATNRGGTPELVDDGRLASLVPSGDAAAFAAAVADLLSGHNDQAIEQRTTLATAAIRQHYDARQVIPRIAEVLSQAAAQRRR